MGFIKGTLIKKQVRKDAELLAEEKLYEYVGQEIASGEIRPGLWTKATSTATSSDQMDIKREYIRLRVEHLRAEGRLFNQFLKEAIEAETEEKGSFVELNEKSRGASLLLTLLLGPLGLFYSTITGAIVMTIITILSAGAENITGLVVCWVLSIAIGDHITHNYNKGIK